MGTARFALTAGDVVEARQQVYRAGAFGWRSLARVGLALGLAIAATGLFFGSRGGISPVTVAAGTILIVVAAALAMRMLNHHLVLPMGAQRQYRANPAAQGDIEIRWDAAELGVCTDGGNSISGWQDFAWVTESARLLLLVQRDGGVAILPKDAIGDIGLAEIRTLLKANGVSASGFHSA